MNGYNKYERFDNAFNDELQQINGKRNDRTIGISIVV